MKRITKNDFEQWLRSKGTRTKVGYTNDNYRTPIYRYLAQMGVSANSVELPKWAEDFQSKVLARTSNSISASAALSLL